MQKPLEITIRDLPPSQALNNHIQEKAHKLERFANNIMSCHVVVEMTQKHQHNGKVYNVRIDLTLPKEEIVVNKVQDENVYIAVRDAFNAVQRKIKKEVKINRGDVKTHEPLTLGQIARLFPEERYGFIESFDGRDFYFNSNNVSYPEFDKLEQGMRVQFLEVVANDGLQANRITINKNDINGRDGGI